MPFDPNMKVDLVKRSKPSPKSAYSVNSAKPPVAGPNPYDECVPVLPQPRSTLSCELGLLQPDLWMRGLWGEEKEGWRDARTNTLFTFDDARKLIEDRIQELGLDAALVHAFPRARRFFSGWVEERQFWNLPFKQRMERFK